MAFGDLDVSGVLVDNTQIEFDTHDPTRLRSHEVYLHDTHGRLREALMGPDGHLYLTTSNCDSRGDCPQLRDAILRVTGGPR